MKVYGVFLFRHKHFASDRAPKPQPFTQCVERSSDVSEGKCQQPRPEASEAGPHEPVRR